MTVQASKTLFTNSSQCGVHTFPRTCMHSVLNNAVITLCIGAAGFKRSTANLYESFTVSKVAYPNEVVFQGGCGSHLSSSICHQVRHDFPPESQSCRL